MQTLLINWYNENKREFPWRNTEDPYKIWISEIMLQQTQTSTVIDYYNRWMLDYPDLYALSHASLEEVYKHWEGLGYYSRAKNIHISANIIVNEYKGIFPKDYKTLLSLKGIGPYTSGAILSLAYNEPVPAVDGNVLRVISRFYEIQKNIVDAKVIKEITQIVQKLINTTTPKLFNQALFDLGATICTPKNPACEKCPISHLCNAFINNTQNVLPISIKKIKKREKSFITGIIQYKDEYMLIKNETGLLENLYGLVQYEVDSPYSFIEVFMNEYHQYLTCVKEIGTFKHVFTHQLWHMHVYLFKLAQANDSLFKDIEAVTISTAHKKILTKYIKGC